MTDAPDGRWFDADALFREALERPAPDRADFVERACADDPELRDAVLELLRGESESAAFLARPVDSLTDVPWDEVLAEATRMTTATP